MSIRSPASDNEIRQWREGYRHHLIEKGIPPAAAWDIAIKIPYRADLYPVATDRFPIQAVRPTAAMAETHVLPIRQVSETTGSLNDNCWGWCHRPVVADCRRSPHHDLVLVKH